MFVIVLAMLVIVAAAGVLVAVMAYPGQGREVPNAPVVNEFLNKVADRLGLGVSERDREDLVGSASSREPGPREPRG